MRIGKDKSRIPILVRRGLVRLNMMVECVILVLLFQSLQPASQGMVMALTQITDSNIKQAVGLWVSKEATARSTYGDISEWDVSAVTSLEKSKSRG